MILKLIVMIKEFNYISINVVLDRILRHPMLRDITKEQAIQYTLDFIGIFGLPKMYIEKSAIIPIKENRGILPCDVVMINQVRNNSTKVCLRASSNSFTPTEEDADVFKTQGNVIVTSLKEGELEISYKGIMVDDEGYPMIPDNNILLKCLENYIKVETFTILFDMGKLNAQILQNAQTQYSWLAGQLHEEFTIPSISEMEALKNSWCTLMQRTTEFDSGFKYNSERELIKVK